MQVDLQVRTGYPTLTGTLTFLFPFCFLRHKQHTGPSTAMPLFELSQILRRNPFLWIRVFLRGKYGVACIARSVTFLLRALAQA